jgi:hypothetical protein
MKKLALILFAGIIVFSGCTNTVTETVTYMINEPVFMSAEDFRESVKVTTTPVEISNYGKMCFFDGYIYISESEKGIHIIDNRNPSNPRNIGFIELIGNADLAIRNGKLYADAYIDLVWFDIGNPSNPTFEGRLENVFSGYWNMPMPQTGNDYGIDYNLCYDMATGSGKGVIVGWNLKKRTEDITYENGRWWGWGGIRSDAMFSTANSGGSSVGINGSMSRFSLYKDYLYSVINNYMSIVDLSGNEPVKAADNIRIGWNVETIFSYKDNMFMGTPWGLLIYSVADPLKPEYMSFVSHVFGCDPVVVENDIAYVTVHSGNMCGQNVNDLMIIDVKDVKNPRLLVTYAMTRPKGLAIDNGTLFVCDDGLKIFDASNPQTLMANRFAHYSGMEGYDVIAFNNVLMMIADDGLYQYDYSDLSRIRQISKLPIVKK